VDNDPDLFRVYRSGCFRSVCLHQNEIYLDELDLLVYRFTCTIYITQIIYITCCSGIIYDIIHDVPFVGRDQKTGETVIFSEGNREQYGAEGFIVSITITGIGLLFISIITIGKRVSAKYSLIAGIATLIGIIFLVRQLEDAYKAKGWYGPSFFPPGDYLTGPISRDQGNNI
jgi:oligosaccharyltransferase complex subunit gamma